MIKKLPILRKDDARVKAMEAAGKPRPERFMAEPGTIEWLGKALVHDGTATNEDAGDDSSK